MQGRGSWWPDVAIPEGAVECYLYRENGVQHRSMRMADGTELSNCTSARKGAEGSERDTASAILAKSKFYKVGLFANMKQNSVAESDSHDNRGNDVSNKSGGMSNFNHRNSDSKLVMKSSKLKQAFNSKKELF